MSTHSHTEHPLPDALCIDDLDQLDFAKSGGLIPAIVQHARTKQVLMQGYMSRDAAQKTFEDGAVTFFSRSKNRLWQKGETSGDKLEFVSMLTDCDCDSLLIFALPHGPTCHLKTPSCFGPKGPDGVGFIAELSNIIKKRALDAPDVSYTARLMAKGLAKIAQKVGEEGVEVALAGRAGDDDELLNESADLIYHLLVLLEARGLSIEDVTNILRNRHLSA